MKLLNNKSKHLRKARPKVATDDLQGYNGWTYVGDRNLEYGGKFYKLDDWEHGYAECVDVTDLDSACGFTGGLIIEVGTITLRSDEGHANALRCCGTVLEDLDNLSTERGKLMLLDALMVYYGMDVDRREVVQTHEEGPMQFDGWKADRRVLSENIEGYIRSKYLSA